MSQPLYQASNSSTSTLRPRTARLISYLDDEQGEQPGPTSIFDTQSQASTETDAGSTSVQQPIRAKSVAHGKAPVRDRDAHARPSSEHGTVKPVASFWEPWASVQGIASTLLGSDVSNVQKGKRKAEPPPAAGPKHNATRQLAEWGPTPSTHPLAIDPSIEERQSMLQAKKREAFLEASVNAGRDILGRYKRRDSNSDIFCNDPEQEPDALVYLHKIQQGDTMAGVAIKYGCQPEVFRKVNRFWPNDNVQTRKQVLLPIDSCSVRGKKMNELDILSSDLETASSKAPVPTSVVAPAEQTSSDFASPLPLLPSPTSLIEDSRHESWVHIAGFQAPVEVLRLPRPSLGYFPPARRKSITTPSENSSPKNSLDMLRHPPTHAASLNASPVGRAAMNYQNTRQRSSSFIAPASSFTDHLKGPGGVGTLRGLRTEPSRPGPGPDPLNRKFAQYLPDLAPPEAFPRTSLRPTPRSTPRASTDSIRSTSSAGLGDMGGAIEGWVRKMANAKSGKTSAPKMGDLIELETNSESGDLLRDEGEHTPTAPTASKAGSALTDEALLNERFPMRGRVRNAYEAKGK